MKKYIIVLLIIFLCCGCSVTYDLTIDENLIFNEEIYFVEDSNYLSKYNTNIKKAVSEIVDFYTNEENNIEPVVILDSKYDVKNSNDEKVVYALTRQHDGVSNFSESLFFNYYFKNSKIITEDNSYTLYANGFNYENIKKLTSEYKYTFEMDDIWIKIQLGYSIINHNADHFDKDNNTLYWKFNKDTLNKDIKIVFSRTETVEINKYYYSGLNPFENVISNIIETTNDKVDGDKIVKDNRVTIYAIITIIVVGIIVYFVRKKIKQSDEL